MDLRADRLLATNFASPRWGLRDRDFSENIKLYPWFIQGILCPVINLPPESYTNDSQATLRGR